METSFFFISEVSKMVGVEAHVLRYWEEELGLEIQRTSQGKRRYTGNDVAQLKEIKYWKDKGMQLKAVKEMMGQKVADAGEELESGTCEHEERKAGSCVSEETEHREHESQKEEYEVIAVSEPADSRKKLEQLLDYIMDRALERNNEKLVQEISEVILQELDEKLEVKLEQFLQEELFREKMREGEREAAAGIEKKKSSRWKRWKKWMDRYI